MSLLHHVVAAYYIHAVAARAYPFAVGIVYCHRGDVESGKQIVGIVGTVVAGHLYLIEAERRVALVFLCQFEETNVGSHPNIADSVFGERLASLDTAYFRHVLVHEMRVAI